ncbi:MAG: prepilin-type N-terminal cleavage/methylation domain-containing protein [Burkholderiaceae bacterium]|nr:prepilin-type N-terminal cleavage/methylation domain-containing protein [Burkholderiaceae bacterium]
MLVPPRRNGLTLVELLVAISILAIVAVLGWRGLDSILRSRAILTNELEQVRAMQLTFAQIQRDCEQIARPGILAGRPVLATAEGRLTLVRNVTGDGQPLRLQVISYRLIDGTLMRSESAATSNLRELDAQWRAAGDAASDTTTIALQSDLSAMTLRYWPGNASGWQTPTSGLMTFSATDMMMPGGLEVTLLPQGRAATVKAMLLGAT